MSIRDVTITFAWRLITKIRGLILNARMADSISGGLVSLLRDIVSVIQREVSDIQKRVSKVGWLVSDGLGRICTKGSIITPQSGRVTVPSSTHRIWMSSRRAAAPNYIGRNVSPLKELY